MQPTGIVQSVYWTMTAALNSLQGAGANCAVTACLVAAATGKECRAFGPSERAD